MKDEIDHPSHYTMGNIESIEMIEAMGHGEGFCVGCIQKYLTRFRFKGTPKSDLMKARWYLDRLISYYGEEG